MSGTTISSYTTAGVTLTATGQSPVTITNSGEIKTQGTAILSAEVGLNASIINFGMVWSTGNTGIALPNTGDGGYRASITNGSPHDTNALIFGYRNGIQSNGYPTISNFGTISGGFGFPGGNAGAIYVEDGEVRLTNGSPNDTSALISGASGGVVAGGGYVANFGTIESGKGAAMNFVIGATVYNAGVIVGAGGVGDGGFSDNAQTIINAGTIIGKTGSTLGFAVVLGVVGTLVEDPGALLVGTVVGGNRTFAGDTIDGHQVLELAAGAETGTIAGFGTMFLELPTIAVDAGADWLVGGSVTASEVISFGGADAILALENPLAAGGTVLGFGNTDTLVLDSFSGTWSYFGDELSFSGGPVFTIGGSVAPELAIETVAGDMEIVAVKSGAVVGKGDVETVPAGALFRGMVVESGGMLHVAAGGEADHIKIEGGDMTISAGAAIAGGIHFSGTGGELAFLGSGAPHEKIYGFEPGDTLVVKGVPYERAARVTVENAGTVTIIKGDSVYRLKISHAKVGETNFRFGPGSVLTMSPPPAMGFLKQGVAVSSSVDLEAGVLTAQAGTGASAAQGVVMGFHEWMREFGGAAPPVVTLHGGI